MSTSLNATGNILYDTITLDKGSLAQGAIYPEESGKADLGSSTKKFDNVYVSGNVPTNEFTKGSWTPRFQWFSGKDSLTTPPKYPPVVNVSEAKYWTYGNEVYLIFSASVSYFFKDRDSGTYASRLLNLPFEVHQRKRMLKYSVLWKSTSNIFRYNSFNSNLFDREVRQSKITSIFINSLNKKTLGIDTLGSTTTDGYFFYEERFYPDNLRTTLYFFFEGIYRKSNPV